MVHEPTGGPLDGPAPGEDPEVLRPKVAVDASDVDAGAGAVVEGCGAVAGVGPGFRHLRVRLRDP